MCPRPKGAIRTAMKDRRDATTAHRPLMRRPHAKRALVNVGGAVEAVGDEVLCAKLTRALTIRPGERDATLTHPFHAYPARLHPAVARSLLQSLSLPPGATLLDPFCGSGTVLIEAMASGLRAVGRDLSPFAVELASLKTRVTSAGDRQRIVAAAATVAMRAEQGVRMRWHAHIPRGEQKWFYPHTLAELSALSQELHRTKGLTLAALRMLFSSILVKVSLQASDSDARKVRKDVPIRAAIRWFADKANELDQCLAALEAAVPAGVSAEVLADDATSLDTIASDSIDGVVTSPPYANTYDYAAQHERRYVWLHLDDKRMIEREVGAARWFKDEPEMGMFRFGRELGLMCRALARVLKKGGRAAVVMADGAAGVEPMYADEMLADAAKGADLKVVARASQVRAVFDDDSMEAFAKRPKREHVVVLGKR